MTQISLAPGSIRNAALMERAVKGRSLWDDARRRLLRNSPRLYSISMGRRIVSVVFRPASGRVGFGQCCHRPSAMSCS